MGFCNSTIKPVSVTKPHIVLIGGYWRVSKMNKPYNATGFNRWVEAHGFVNKLNFIKQG